MDDKEQAAIDALRAAGLDAEADAVQALRARHSTTMDAYHAGQRASYAAGQVAERERWTSAASLAIEALEWHASACCEDSIPQDTVDSLAALRKALGPNVPVGED